jgi:hypothetical protein
MDLSGLKWPIIIALVVGGIWLCTAGGTEFLFSTFTKATPGEDVGRDARDEAGLRKLGTFLMMTFRYGHALDVMETSMERYGESGADYWHNYYRSARCYEKLKEFGASHAILRELVAQEAWLYDERVPGFNTLKLRADKLQEVHQLF